MASGKTSFVLYCDLNHTVGHLTDEQAGRLFKHILRYVNDENPITDDAITNISFEPIKQQLKRDLKKWKGEKKKKSLAGKKGMANRWGDKGLSDNTTITENNSVIKPITEITVNDNVSVNVTVSDTVNVIELNDIEIGATIEFCSYGPKRNYDKERISELWKAFLINGQNKSYATREKKLNHFRNWIKTQPYANGTHKQTNPGSNGKHVNRKDASAHDLLESLKTDYDALKRARDNQAEI